MFSVKQVMFFVAQFERKTVKKAFCAFLKICDENIWTVFTVSSAALYKWDIDDANIMLREGDSAVEVTATRTGTLRDKTISK